MAKPMPRAIPVPETGMVNPWPAWAAKNEISLHSPAPSERPASPPTAEAAPAAAASSAPPPARPAKLAEAIKQNTGSTGSNVAGMRSVRSQLLSGETGPKGEVEDLKKGYMQLARADLDSDFQSGDSTFYHLRDGIERFMITDINNPAASATAQSEIPVMFETVRKQRPPRSLRRTHGYNVLYLDGHVEFLNYGEQFPATDAVADAFPPPRP